MKKLLALALALVMIFCLAACGENKDDDDGTKTTTTVPTGPNTPNVPGFSAGAKVGMSIADLDALLQPLFNGDAGTDVEDLYFELGASDTNVLLALGAKLLGENVDANLFLGEDIVLSAPALLDKNYGISMENLMALMENMVGSAGAAAPAIDPEVVIELVSKYYGLLIDGIKNAEGITATEEGDSVLITGTMDSDAIAVIVIDILEAACADDDFFALMGAMQGVDPDEFKQAFLQGKPSKDELLTQMKAVTAQFEVELKIDGLLLTDGIPEGGDFTLSLNQDMEGGNRPAEAFLEFDMAAGKFYFALKDEGPTIIEVKIGDGRFYVYSNLDGVTTSMDIQTTDEGMTITLKENNAVVVEVSFTITANGFRASMTSNGETMSIELAVSDNGVALTMNFRGSEMKLEAKASNDKFEGSLSMDGQEMGKITFAKKVEGSKTSFTLTTLSIQGTEVDFSEGGLSFYIDTNAEISAAPDYTDITTMDNDELEAVLDKFMTDNADLIEMFSDLFGGMMGDASEGGTSNKNDNLINAGPSFAA